MARWLDADADWKESFAFAPFRTRGDGPVLREKGTAIGLGKGALPIDLGPDFGALLGERCPFVFPASDRSLILACEEGAGDTPLATRATLRSASF
ncbi:MAG: hypothetical protein NVS3B20_25470 [Polyangiales bacterium]